MNANSYRPLYDFQVLSRLFDPASIAIVGASPRAGSFGERTLANLHRFGGRIHLVNAKYGDIAGRPCHPSIAALPEVPDLVVATVAREAVEAVALECAELGVGGLVIYASGYAESGLAERELLQKNLTAIAARSGLRILGPNCVGYLAAANGAYVTFSPTPEFGQPGPHALGLVSQSGALGVALSQAAERGVSFSHVMAPGNSCDVDVSDCVGYLADDPSCSTIVCVFEGMAQPARLLEAAARARAAGKAVIVYKLGTGTEGAAAAMSHTGSLAGSQEVFAAAFARAGMVVVDDFESLIETAAFFAKAGKPRAGGVAVLAASGGAAIMSADKAELHGVKLPQPAPATERVLKEHIPEFGSARNPCDVTAQVVNFPESLNACANALMQDDQYAALLSPYAYAYAASVDRALKLGDIAASHGKLLCQVWLSEWLEGPGAALAERHPHVAMFRSMGRCFATIAAWQQQLQWTPLAVPPRRAPADAAGTARALIGAAPQDTLTEREAKAVLSGYGIATVCEQLVGSAAEAGAAAAGLGFPVAIKVESPQLPHKTEAGVIRLSLRTPQEVEQAFDEVMKNAHAAAPGGEIRGVLVQPMAPKGIEVMVGGVVDPMFGPVVLVGLGGTMVELMGDVARELAPVGPATARAMLERLKGAQLLRGFRGGKGVDMDALADMVCRVSEFLADQQDTILELDINPVICSADAMVAVDALVVRRPEAAGR